MAASPDPRAPSRGSKGTESGSKCGKSPADLAVAAAAASVARRQLDLAPDGNDENDGNGDGDASSASYSGKSRKSDGSGGGKFDKSGECSPSTTSEEEEDEEPVWDGDVHVQTEHSAWHDDGWTALPDNDDEDNDTPGTSYLGNSGKSGRSDGVKSGKSGGLWLLDGLRSGGRRRRRARLEL